LRMKQNIAPGMPWTRQTRWSQSHVDQAD